MKKIVLILISLCFALNLNAATIRNSPRFDTSVPFPKSRSCSPTTSYGIGDFSSEGYCAVGWTRVNYDSPVGTLGSGEYLIVFLRNSSSGDQVLYHVYSNDIDQGEFDFEALVTKVDGKQSLIQGNVRDGTSGSMIGDYLSSARGQTMMRGVAQGLLQGIAMSEAAAEGKASRVRQFGLSGQQQVQISVRVAQERDKQSLSFADLLREVLKRGMSFGSEPKISMDPTLRKNLSSDLSIAAGEGNWSEFIDLEGFLFENIENLSGLESENIDLNGILKIAGPVKFVSSYPEGKMALNGVIISSWVSRPAPNDWYLAQKNYYIQGVVLEKQGRKEEAREKYQISTELSKVTANISMRSRLSIGQDGQIKLDEKGDIKGFYFDPSINEALVSSSLEPFKISERWSLSKAESMKLAAQRAYAEQLQNMLPPVKWAFSLANKLMALSDKAVSVGDVQLALLAGDLANASLDALTNFTFVGAAGEAALNLLSGYNIRTGEALSDKELALNILSLVPARWLMSGKTLTVQVLGKIVGEINPIILDRVATMAAKVEKLTPYIPDALSKNRPALERAIEVIEQATPPGQNWQDKAVKILDASKDLKGFNLGTLGEIVENRKLLTEIRDGYNVEIGVIQKVIAESGSKGKSLEAIAREAHGLRRSIGEKYKNMTPNSLRSELYGRNLVKYGDELGPTFEKLVEKNLAGGATLEKAYSQVIENSVRSNVSLNSFIEMLKREFL